MREQSQKKLAKLLLQEAQKKRIASAIEPPQEKRTNLQLKRKIGYNVAGTAAKISERKDNTVDIVKENEQKEVTNNPGKGSEQKDIANKPGKGSEQTEDIDDPNGMDLELD